MRVRGQRDVPLALRPGQRPGTHFTGGRFGPKGFYIKTNKKPDTKRTEDLLRARYSFHPSVFLYHFGCSHYSQQSWSVALTVYR